MAAPPQVGPATRGGSYQASAELEIPSDAD